MNRLRAGLSAIRSSYGFVPSVLALLAVLLGAGLIWLDVRLGSSWVQGISWYQQIRPDGAREVLSTIDGDGRRRGLFHHHARAVQERAFALQALLSRGIGRIDLEQANGWAAADKV